MKGINYKDFGNYTWGSNLYFDVDMKGIKFMFPKFKKQM